MIIAQTIMRSILVTLLFTSMLAQFAEPARTSSVVLQRSSNDVGTGTASFKRKLHKSDSSAAKSTKSSKSKITKSTESSWSYKSFKSSKSKPTKSSRLMNSRKVKSGKSTSSDTAKSPKASSLHFTKSSESVKSPKKFAVESHKSSKGENSESMVSSWLHKSPKSSDSKSTKSSKSMKGPKVPTKSFKSKNTKSSKSDAAKSSKGSSVQSSKSKSSKFSKSKSIETSKSKRSESSKSKSIKSSKGKRSKDSKSANSPKSLKSEISKSTKSSNTDSPSKTSPVSTMPTGTPSRTGVSAMPIGTLSRTGVPTSSLMEVSLSPSTSPSVAVMTNRTNTEFDGMVVCREPLSTDVETIVNIDYQLTIGSTDIDSEEEVNSILEDLERMIAAHLSTTSCKYQERKLRKIARRLELVQMEFSGTRTMKANSCVSGRSEITCTVEATSEVRIVTNSTEINFSMCALLKQIETFFASVYSPGNIENADELVFMRSDKDSSCSNIYGIIKDKNGTDREGRRVFIGWWLATSLTAFIAIIFIRNGCKTRRERLRDNAYCEDEAYSI